MKVAIIQLCSKLDPKHNLKTVYRLGKEAKEAGYEYLFLPECFYSMSDGLSATPYLVEKGNEHYLEIQALAQKLGVYLLGGSAATVNPESGKPINRLYNFSPEGVELSFYDKNHLFSCELGEGKQKKIIREADIYTKGKKLQLLKVGELNLGLSICFDLRYPDMYREYRQKGANAFSISSAFTIPTGKAHWETLIRARAIENQSFVIASAQWGGHNERVSTFGHSLIVDPWGEVLLNLKEGEKWGGAILDLSKVAKVRKIIKMD